MKGDAGKIRCCYQCGERRVGCHGTCERYLAERKAADDELERREIVRQGMYGVIDSRINNRAFRRNNAKRGG